MDIPRFPSGASGREPACHCRRYKRCGFHPWVGKMLWRRKWQPTPVFLPGKIPWTEELGRLQSMGWPRVGHDRMTECMCAHTHKHTHKHTHARNEEGATGWQLTRNWIVLTATHVSLVPPVMQPGSHLEVSWREPWNQRTHPTQPCLDSSPTETMW